VPASCEHRFDKVVGAGEHGFHSAVAPVAHPSGKPVQLGLMANPRAKSDPLNIASHENMDNAGAQGPHLSGLATTGIIHGP
jgi:hypothetical protein